MNYDISLCVIPIMILAVLYSFYQMMKDLEEYACNYKDPDKMIGADDEKI